MGYEIRSIYNLEKEAAYGEVRTKLSEFMSERKITISALSKKSGLNYDVVRRYHNGVMQNFNGEVLSKICFCLKCELSDILEYALPNEYK